MFKRLLLFLSLVIVSGFSSAGLFDFLKDEKENVKYSHKIIKTTSVFDIYNTQSYQKVSMEEEYHLNIFLNIEDIFEEYYNFESIVITKNNQSIKNKIDLVKEEVKLQYKDDIVLSSPYNTKDMDNNIYLNFSFSPMMMFENNSNSEFKENIYNFKILNKQGITVLNKDKKINELTSISYFLVKNPFVKNEVFYKNKDKEMIAKVYNNIKTDYKVEMIKSRNGVNIKEIFEGKKSDKDKIFKMNNVKRDDLKGVIFSQKYMDNIDLEHHIILNVKENEEAFYD